MYIGDAVKEIKPALSDCEATVSDLEKLSALAALLTNPVSLVYHIGKDLIVNGHDIYHEIEDSVTQYHNAHYKYFGFDIGMALAKLIIGQEGPMEVDQSTLTLY